MLDYVFATPAAMNTMSADDVDFVAHSRRAGGVIWLFNAEILLHEPTCVNSGRRRIFFGSSRHNALNASAAAARFSSNARFVLHSSVAATARADAG